MKTPNSRMSEVLVELKKLNHIALDTVSPRIARELPGMKQASDAVLNAHLLTRLTSGAVEEVGRIEHRLIPTVNGELLLRCYYPKTQGPLPVLLYFHGGGFVIGQLNSADASCRSLANGADCIVISPAYRQAPEFKYPAAHDDAFEAYLWTLNHAEEIGGDSMAIAIGGESAGGNLAAATCLRARAERIRLPVHQLLVYPLLDNDTETESYFENRDAQPLNRAGMLWFFRHYVPVEGDEYAFPLQANDLNGLPSATIISAEIDPLRDEAEAYADRLREAGVAVVNERYLGVTHEFFGLKSILSEARDANQLACDNLEHAFANSFSLHEERARPRNESSARPLA